MGHAVDACLTGTHGVGCRRSRFACFARRGCFVVLVLIFTSCAIETGRGFNIEFFANGTKFAAVRGRFVQFLKFARCTFGAW